MEQQLQPSGQAQNVPEKKAWYKKWWVVTIAIIAILYAIGNSAVEDTKQKVSDDIAGAPAEENKTADTQTVAPEKSIPDVTVTSAVLAKEYKENEVAADSKYKGKLIEITGKITGVTNGTFDDEIIVKLSDGEYDFNGSQCYMKESERDKALAMKKDQTVTLIGTGNSATIGSPMLKDCWVK